MTFPLATFRSLYTAFADTPDADVMAASNEAACLYSGGVCGGNCSESAWMALTAHVLAASGDTGGGGSVTSATIGDVSVTREGKGRPRDDLSFWLSSTPYGLKALALIKACNPIGKYYGGRQETAAIRRQRW